MTIEHSLSSRYNLRFFMIRRGTQRLTQMIFTGEDIKNERSSLIDNSRHGKDGYAEMKLWNKIGQAQNQNFSRLI